MPIKHTNTGSETTPSVENTPTHAGKVTVRQITASPTHSTVPSPPPPLGERPARFLMKGLLQKQDRGITTWRRKLEIEPETTTEPSHALGMGTSAPFTELEAPVPGATPDQEKGTVKEGAVVELEGESGKEKKRGGKRDVPKKAAQAVKKMLLFR
ncbi:hypothetical protein EJ05DRAFT_517663 [Pseudovirgaria hyperparasitica]|uniref:Uncharacterized protein n=1 Tax=Pseudovirgaria hyperparasitica TaxID=470096 RepID=A0A6A6W5H7_9PEZI|nr:uncharacterized protein EJ05DRAFT_517663 [Pseudovirgaria hyperparasitica]KAF2757206.1 hypothetical protein EJ05DRAFT_517663 [Pseudovirgaria hyperparasitica]